MHVRFLCPPLSTVLIITACYRHSVDLFVNGTSLLSEEGTTEGGPLAMPFLYALATVPLIKELSSVNVQQECIRVPLVMP